MKYIIYNFSGCPGDLYQLVPDKFLATLCAVLDEVEPGSTQVWDRGNLRDAGRLLPGAPLQNALRYAGKRLFGDLRRHGEVATLTKLLFGSVNVMAHRGVSARANEFIREDAQRILDASPEAVFLNLRHGPGFEQTILLAETLRRQRSSLKIFGIGHRASWFGRHLAALYEPFDAFVIGPSSYETMVALALGTSPGDLQNVVFRQDGKIIETQRVCEHDPSHAVLPEYAPEKYLGVDAQLPFREIALANEACPFSCAFCVRPPTYGTRWKAREVSRIVDEISFRVHQEGIRCFRCSDSTPPPGLLTEVAREMIDRGLHREDLHLSTFGRVNRNLREDYGLLREAGFEAVFFGIESGSQRVLDEVLGKSSTVAEIKEAIREAHLAGLAPVASFMFPTPGETPESRRETLELIEQIKPFLAGILVQPSGVYPGTTWHLEAERFGIRLDDDYVTRAVTYPIDPVKPISLWPAFPFSYDLMGKPADKVTFKDITGTFSEFAKAVWNDPAHGGLGIPNVQDYGIILARHLGRDPVDFSRQCLTHLVTRDLSALQDYLTPASRQDVPAA